MREAAIGCILSVSADFYDTGKVRILVNRSPLIARALLTLLFSYAITIGATFNGILTPQLKFLNLALLTVIVVVWFGVRWRRGWRWNPTPLDAVFILWVIAFAVSLAANFDNARQISIGLWFVGFYIAVWYALADSLTNGAISREVVVDALLISGLVVLIFGFLQLQLWLSAALAQLAAGGGLPPLPRPVSTLGNPNTLGNWLVVVIPFIVARFAAAPRRAGKIFLGLYGLLSLLLLFLTFSRGGWLGVLVGLVIWGALWLASHNLLSLSRLQEGWRAQSARTHGLFIGAGIVTLLVGLGVGIIFLRSFTQAGRTATLRTDIYQAAVNLFTEKPITGYGLFTFGRGLARFQSSPPDQLHSHAHNAPLHIAAELGLIGLLALAVTLLVMVLAMRRNWQTADQRQEPLLAAAVAAVAGFAVHQLTDIPAMMPAIALTGLVALALAVVPVSPKAATVSWRRLVYSIAVPAMYLVLLGTGLWNSINYNNYVAALRYGIESGDYRGAGDRVGAVIAADPGLPLYYKEQAFLYGMAGVAGDAEAAQLALDAYQQLLARDPANALAYANMASLHRLLGDDQQAVEAMGESLERAPESWQFALNLARYAETAGDQNVVVLAYDRVLTEYPDAALYPELEVLNQRQQMSSVMIELSPPAQALLLVEAGQAEQASELLANSSHPNFYERQLAVEVAALARDDRPAAQAALEAIEGAAQASGLGVNMVWVHAARARMARFDGDDALAETELAAAREVLERGPFDGDWLEGINYAHAQTLSLAIARQFLPGVEYPLDSPILLRVLATT